MKRGQPLFEDRKAPGALIHTAPGAGRIIGIHRGAAAACCSRWSSTSRTTERAGSPSDDSERVALRELHRAASPSHPRARRRSVALLVESGHLDRHCVRVPSARFWRTDTAPIGDLRERPWTRQPPRAPCPRSVLAERGGEPSIGASALLSKLTDGNHLRLPRPPLGTSTPRDRASPRHRAERVLHGATPGRQRRDCTSIILEPVNREKTVWHIGYQDVVATSESSSIDRQLDVTERVICRRRVRRHRGRPRLSATRTNGAPAEVDDVVRFRSGFGVELRHDLRLGALGQEGDGRRLRLSGPLRRPDQRLWREDRETRVHRLARPWPRRRSPPSRSTSRSLCAVKKLRPYDDHKRLARSRHGAHRHVRARDAAWTSCRPSCCARCWWATSSRRTARCLELDEEDLALCTFVCPGKTNYGPSCDPQEPRDDREGRLRESVPRRRTRELAPLFEKGGKLEFFYPLWEAHVHGPLHAGRGHQDGLPRARRHRPQAHDDHRGDRSGAVHRSHVQHGLPGAARDRQGAVPLDRLADVPSGTIGGSPSTSRTDPRLCVLFGALSLRCPSYAVAMLTGGIVESRSSPCIRKHEVNEGFLVTGMLSRSPCRPPSRSGWSCIGTAFGLIIGKEIFGGTGMNFLNPALVARAFLFFAYPAAMSGDAPGSRRRTSGVDSFTGATLLARRLSGRRRRRTRRGRAWDAPSRLHARAHGGDVGARLPARRSIS